MHAVEHDDAQLVQLRALVFDLVDLLRDDRTSAVFAFIVSESAFSSGIDFVAQRSGFLDLGR